MNNLSTIHLNKLPQKFYQQELHALARNLLGKIFVRVLGSIILAGKIVEVEAYGGMNDEASHAFSGKTERNKVMFGEAGNLYVYFTYGMHYCANVVCGNSGVGMAVLIRALEPIDGIELMQQNRFGNTHMDNSKLKSLTNGPAKLCQSFGINRSYNGISLLGNELYICDAPPLNDSQIVISKRIGIKKSIDLPWRYYIKENAFVSKK